ncbi:hypothetical protein Micbo1qcDRAFT_164935 [Microdochium bolleyi]|uniref:Gag1-like clamp domain-containing protein n=1 Tax=Microdochium bolleyi TaxID=196109 RepID=A0A136IXH5_9PEZI|nr:hypothetical protein Micbo1qcDRAFT_164935 [Microdochium bolleyi]
MIFGSLYKSSKRLRPQQQPVGSDVDHGDPDLITKDKIKQKNAVRRYLDANIRNDWHFAWPDPADETQPTTRPIRVDDLAVQSSPAKDKTTESAAEDSSDDADDAVSTYSTVSEDNDHFRRRIDWTSDFSDDDEPISPAAYRFESPDAVGSTVCANELSRAAQRRKAHRDEMEWNYGLAWFSARRDAWTAARTVRVKPKPAPVTPVSQTSRRHSLWRFSSNNSTATPLSPAETASPKTLSRSATRTSAENSAATTSSSSDNDSKAEAAAVSSSGEDHSNYPVETLLPIPRPLLPAANPMRASITPASYPSIYDKIVVHSLTPACPINLNDVIKSCVVGWKRDGEWPPRAMEMPTASVVAVRQQRKRKDSNATNTGKPSAGRRLSLGGFLGRRESAAGISRDQGQQRPVDGAAPEMTATSPTAQDDEATTKGLRKSLQRALGFGHDRSGSTASNNGPVLG